MGDFEEKLNAILSNPQAMAQVASLAQSLNLGGERDDSQSSESFQDINSEQKIPNSGTFTGVADLLGQIDPALISRLLPLISEFTDQSGNEARMQLLYALRPFLKAERQEKIERAAKAAKLLHIGKKFLTSMGDPNV